MMRDLDDLQETAEASPSDAALWSRLAEASEAAGQAERALSAWSRVIELGGGPADVRSRVAQLLRGLARPAEAMSQLRIVAEAAPANIKVWSRFARTCEEADDVGEAAAAWLHVAALDGANLVARRQAAQYLAAQGLHAQAVEHLRVVTAAEPDDAKTWARLARSLELSGDPEGAVVAWRSVFALNGGSFVARDGFADLLSSLGRHGEALPHLRALVEAEPGESKSWARLARCLEGVGAAAEAKDAWTRVLATVGFDAEAHEQLAQLAEAEGRPADALVHYRALADADPSSEKFRNRVVRVLEQSANPANVLARVNASYRLASEGRHAEAVEHLRAVTEAEPWNVKMWARLARSLQESGDPAAAVVAWRRVFDLDGDNFVDRDGFSDLLSSLGWHAEALPHLRTMVEAESGEVKYWARLARSLEGVGHLAEASEAWGRVLALAGYDAEAHEQLAQLAEAQGRPADAVVHYQALFDVNPSSDKFRSRLERALEQLNDPNNPVARMHASYQLASVGRHAEAAEHLRVVIEADPTDAKMWARLARSLEQSGDPQGAVVAWRRVLELDGANFVARDGFTDLLIGLGWHAEALPHLQAMVEAEPGESKYWARLARSLEGMGAGGEAVRAWNRVLAVAGYDAEAHEQLAQLAEVQARPADAVFHYQALLDANPSSAKFRSRLERALDQLNDPNNPLARMHASKRMVTEGRHAEAVEHLRVVTEAEPSDANAWARMARSLEELDDLEGAAEAWRRSLELGGDVFAEREAYVDLLSALNRHAEALPHLQAIAEAAPGEAKNWARLARSLEEVSATADAVEAWRRVLTIQGDDEEAHEKLAQLAEAEGRSTDAAFHYQALVDANPISAKNWSRLARALEPTGQVEREIAAWNRVLATEEDTEGRRRLAQVLLTLGRTDQAHAHLRELADPDAALADLWRRLERRLTAAGDEEGATAARRRVIALEDADTGDGPQDSPGGMDDDLRTYCIGQLQSVAALDLFLSPAFQGRRITDLLTFTCRLAGREGGELDPRLERAAFHRCLQSLIFLSSRVDLSDPDNVAERWRCTSEVCRSPQFIELSARFPDELAQFVGRSGGLGPDTDPLADEAIVELVRSAARIPAASLEARALADRAAKVNVLKDRVLSSDAFFSPVLICGFHHSGTRLLAELLELAGVFQVAQTSSYEWNYVQVLNTLILPGWANPDRIERFDAGAAVLPVEPERIAFRLAASGYDADKPWGHKDPRNCLTADAWMTAFPRLRIVNLVRNPLDTIGALPGRYAQYVPSGRRPQDEPELWIRLWRDYLERTRSSMSRAWRACEVRFEDICVDPVASIQTVLDALDLGLKVESRQFDRLEIDPTRIGSYRSWVDNGELGRSMLSDLERLAREAGYAADGT